MSAGMQEVTIPLTVQTVMERGCAGVLYESFRRLGDKGIMKTAQEARIRDSNYFDQSRAHELL